MEFIIEKAYYNDSISECDITYYDPNDPDCYAFCSAADMP